MSHTDALRIAMYHGAKDRLAQEIPELTLSIEQGRFAIILPFNQPHSDGGRAMFVTEDVRELEVFVDGLVKGLDLEHIIELLLHTKEGDDESDESLTPSVSEIDEGCTLPT